MAADKGEKKTRNDKERRRKNGNNCRLKTAAMDQLTPEQRQQVMVQAQNSANQQVMQQLMDTMTKTCFQRCAGTSVRGFMRTECGMRLFWISDFCRPHSSCFNWNVRTEALFISSHLTFCTSSSWHLVQGDKLDSREQGCMAMCQDRYLDVRGQVTEALQKRQEMS